MLGYCTNVHSGTTYKDVLENIRTICKSICTRNANTGVGLWLSNQTTLEVDISQLKYTLQDCGVRVFTFNGFPYGNFHSDIVRHKVYEPNWCDPRRLEYTIRLANILANIVEGDSAGISTLPLGWNSDSFQNEDAAKMIRQCVDQLSALENQTGVCIHLDIETEPGCRLQLAKELAAFINSYFGDDEEVRRYLRVCHDTCHAAVMHETAEEAVTHYKQAGLYIGKVQLSSAIEVDFDAEYCSTWVSDLLSIAENRYLHQSTILHNNQMDFFENLSDVSYDTLAGILRVHFHVPIHQSTIGSLQTTQEELLRSIPILKQAGAIDWEVETYTWSVMPTAMQQGNLIDSITKELEWAASNISK